VDFRDFWTGSFTIFMAIFLCKIIIICKLIIFFKSFQRQIYRFGQLAFPQVGGCFTDKSAIRTKKQKSVFFLMQFLNKPSGLGNLQNCKLVDNFLINSASVLKEE
jgi:hypothetical protein